MRAEAIEDMYELTPMQQGMLYDSLLEPRAGVYVVQFNILLEGQLDADAFRRAWQQVLGRHSVLRTSFHWKELDKTLQVVNRHVTLPWEQHDWSELPAGEQQRRTEDFLRADRERGFELSRAPLMRLSLVRLGALRHQLIWSFHHILLDGWSVPLVLKEVFAFYYAHSDGRELRLERPRSYRAYMSWLQRQDAASAELFWRRTLRGFTAPTVLRVERARDEPLGAGDQVGEQQVRLSTEATAALKSIVQRQQVTLNTLVQGMWALLLSRYSGEEDVVFGSVVSGRPAELEGSEWMVGLFINTLPVRVRVRPAAFLPAWLKQIQEQQSESRQYEYSSLVQIQGWGEVPRGLPLFESLVVFENYPVGEIPHKEDGRLKIVHAQSLERVNYALSLLVESYAELQLNIHYDRQRFHDDTVRRMLGHLQTLLENVIENPRRRLAELEMLTAGERRQLLVEWNGPHTPFPRDKCVHHLFLERALRSPDSPALSFNGLHLSYRQLNERANQLAHRLRRLGVGPERLVGVLLPRSAEVVVALLGVLKAGGAYLPLDPAYPAARLRFMLEDAGVSALVTTRPLLGGVPPNGARVVCVDEEAGGLEAESLGEVESGVGAENLAYVIYTSGSTGRPKGALVHHRGLCNLAFEQQRIFGEPPAGRVLQFSSLSFDASIFEMMMALCAGARLCLATGEQLRPGPPLLKTLREQEVTNVTLPPSVLATLPEEELGQLRTIIAAGEACPRELVERWAGGRRFYNAYGPTEATVWTTLEECEVGGGKPKIGRAIGNVEVYVLDESHRMVGVGMVGELYIGGEGVARGYLKRPGLTSERFVPHPYSERGGARLYRTGDLVRYAEGGRLEYIGRADQQVKVRGFRIELGEIEAALSQHPAVKVAAVIAREDAPGDKRLVAYVVTAGKEHEHAGRQVNAEEWRGYLKGRLPEHMVPSAFVMLEGLPLTPNGKLDVRALPAPGHGRNEFEPSFVAPRDTLELRLKQIWEDVLGVSHIGIRDDFFELGGHSLLAVRLSARIEKEFGRELPLSMLVQGPTIEHLASGLRRQGAVPAQTSLVAIQPRGTKPPLFFVHPASGNVVCYLPLAQRLGQDRPFFGLQDPAVLHDPGAQEDLPNSNPGIEEMAARYLKELRAVQKVGPYALGGWSFGCFVAFEMAQQLKRDGQEVSLLAMLDSGPVHARRLAEVKDDAHLLAIIAKEQGLAVTLDDLRGLAPGEQITFISEQFRKATPVLGDELASWLQRQLRIFKQRVRAAQSYKMKPYEGQIVLLRARDGEPDESSVAGANGQPGDETFGWGEYSDEPVRVSFVPGNHASMGREPHVEVLADALKPYL
jgi:amino acid adenylation domain-containing protein